MEKYAQFFDAVSKRISEYTGEWDLSPEEAAFHLGAMFYAMDEIDRLNDGAFKKCYQDCVEKVVKNGVYSRAIEERALYTKTRHVKVRGYVGGWVWAGVVNQSFHSGCIFSATIHTNDWEEAEELECLLRNEGSEMAAHIFEVDNSG